MHRIQILCILFIGLIVSSCDKSNNPVSNQDAVAPGRRDYVWTVDTIREPYNSFVDITGTSPQDLWTANPGDARKIFYHYDGSKWQTDLVFRSFAAKSIYSLSPNDVWSSGEEGRIWHFDGSTWKEVYKHSVGAITDIVFEDIYAIASNDIYAAGQYFDGLDFWGIIVHYDGHSWKQIAIPQIRTAFITIRKISNGKLYLLGVTNELTKESTYQLYEFDGVQLKLIKSGTQAKNQMGGIINISSKVYFIIGFDFYDYNDGTFVRLGNLSDSNTFLNVAFGTSSKNIFLGMRDGIAHYNGENTEYLFKTQDNIYVRTGIAFEKDVFFVGMDMKGNNLIIHGKLVN